jgi:hypothetical protein
MKFTPEKFTPQAIATLAFTMVGAIAFGYFKVQMSPPSPNLEPGQKKRPILYNKMSKRRV